MKAAMSLEEAASETPWTSKFLRDAIHATDPASYPPPLRAKTTSFDKRGRPRGYVVLADDLSAWLQSLPDA